MNTGKYTLTTSISATLTGMSLNDIAQLIAFIVAIISGLFAIRHYWLSAKLSKLKIEEAEENNNGNEAKTNH